MKKLDKYLKKTNIKRSFEPSQPKRLFNYAIIIPVFSEYDYIFNTLKALSNNNKKYLNETIVILVINNSQNCSNLRYNENQKTLRELNTKKTFYDLNLYWLDAATSYFELPGDGGVGMARKLGMDTALNYLNWKNSPLIFSLDADTIPNKDYLKNAIEFFSHNEDIIGAYSKFKHQFTRDIELNKAIRKYEFFLYYYKENLRKAGSPYAYYAIGSTIIFKAEYYIMADGMNLRKGAEDFYFMQALRKLGKIKEIPTTIVYPSPRDSFRVPFGTGPTMNVILSGQKLYFYNPYLFNILKKTLKSVKLWANLGYFDTPEYLIKLLPEEAAKFFEQSNFINKWQKIYKNLTNSKKTINKERLEWNFHIWFDAFKTLKFIHYIEKNFEQKYPRINYLEARKCLSNNMMNNNLLHQ